MNPNFSLVTNELALQLNREALQRVAVLPTSPILLIEGIKIEEVMAWLSQVGCYTFGKTCSISDDEGRREFAEWFILQIKRFYSYRALDR